MEFVAWKTVSGTPTQAFLMEGLALSIATSRTDTKFQ